MPSSLNPVGVIIVFVFAFLAFTAIGHGISNSVKAKKAESTILYTEDPDKRRRFIRHCLDMGNIAVIKEFGDTVEVTCKPFKRGKTND